MSEFSFGVQLVGNHYINVQGMILRSQIGVDGMTSINLTEIMDFWRQRIVINPSVPYAGLINLRFSDFSCQFSFALPSLQL